LESSFEKFFRHDTEKPRSLFLMDSLGAFLTAIFLYSISRNLEAYFGMPREVLTHLSLLAVCYGVFSFSCFNFIREKSSLFLWIIGIANLAYSVIIGGLLLKFHPLLTRFDFVYFLMEIVFISGLGLIELKVASLIKKNDTP